MDLDPELQYTTEACEGAPSAIPIKINMELFRLLESGDCPEMEMTFLDDIPQSLGLGGESSALQPMGREESQKRIESYNLKGTRLIQTGLLTQRYSLTPTIDASRFKVLTKEDEDVRISKRSKFVKQDSLLAKGKHSGVRGSSPRTQISPSKTIQTRQPTQASPIEPKRVKQISPVETKKRSPPDLKALRNTLIHFLAPSPKGLEECLQRTNLDSRTIKLMLMEIGSPQASKPDSFQLKNESYKELSPWLHKDYTEKERKSAIKNATIAFDSLGLDKFCIERKALLSSPNGSEKSESSKSSAIKLDAFKVKETILEGVKGINRPKEKPKDIWISDIVESPPVLKDISKKVMPHLDVKEPGIIVEELAIEKKSNKRAFDSKIENLKGEETAVVKKLRPSSISSPRHRVKRRIGKLLISTVGPDDWKTMAVSDLEKYATWLRRSRKSLEETVIRCQKVSSLICNSVIHKGRAQEKEKLSLIRSMLMDADQQSDPSTFIAQLEIDVSQFKIVCEELEALTSWIVSQGGSIDLMV